MESHRSILAPIVGVKVEIALEVDSHAYLGSQPSDRKMDVEIGLDLRGNIGLRVHRSDHAEIPGPGVRRPLVGELVQEVAVVVGTVRGLVFGAGFLSPTQAQPWCEQPEHACP